VVIFHKFACTRHYIDTCRVKVKSLNIYIQLEKKRGELKKMLTVVKF